MKKRILCGIAAAALSGIPGQRAAMAHGFEGDRFFPPTIATDDPFAVDELSFPTVSVSHNPPAPGGSTTREIDIGGEFDKEILPGWNPSFSDVFTTLNPKVGAAANGFQNFDLATKFELIQSPA